MCQWGTDVGRAVVEMNMIKTYYMNPSKKNQFLKKF